MMDVRDAYPKNDKEFVAKYLLINSCLFVIHSNTHLLNQKNDSQ